MMPTIRETTQCPSNSEAQPGPEEFQHQGDQLQSIEQQQQELVRELLSSPYLITGMTIHEDVEQSEVIQNSIDQQSSTDPATADRLAITQLSGLLKCPNTPEQENQILQVLRSHPRLMAAFVKQRQQQIARQRRRRRMRLSA